MRRDDETPMNGADRADDPPPAGGERPVDLGVLRDARAAAPDAARWEALARRIDAAATPELARRRALPPRDASAAPGAPMGVLPIIARAVRPALLAAAATIAFVAVTARVTEVGESTTLASAVDGDAAGMTQALRLAEPAASWIVQERAPSTADLAREIGLEEAPR